MRLQRFYVSNNIPVPQVGILKNSFMFNTLMFFPCCVQSTHITISWNQLSSMNKPDILKENNWSLLQPQLHWLQGQSAMVPSQMSDYRALWSVFYLPLNVARPPHWFMIIKCIKLFHHTRFQVCFGDAYTQTLTYFEIQISCHLKMSSKFGFKNNVIG